jgi:glycosyltransferase involved in cell wall biosynthesis
MNMINKCELSIVIPVYNCSKTIEACLSSLLNQTINGKMCIEFVVVDDGSTDNTREIVRKFPVTLIENRHTSRSVTKNTGFLASHGDLVFFVEADAYYDPVFLERLVEPMLKNPKAGTVSIYGDPWPSEHIFYKWWKEQNTLKNINYVALGGSVFRRSDLERIGLFDSSLPRGEDVELCNRLRKLGYVFVRDSTPYALWWHKEPDTFKKLFRHSFHVGDGLVTFQKREGVVRKTLISSMAYVSLFALFVGLFFVSLAGLLPSFVLVGLVGLFVLSYLVPVLHVKNKGQRLREYKLYIVLYPFVRVPSHLCFSIGFLKEFMFPTKA